jgi:dienelactone hydrolase
MDRTIPGRRTWRERNPGSHFASIERGSGLMNTTGGTRWSLVPTVLGMLLFAAGAADGHDLVISARDADWALLVRAELELLAGVWLLSGRLTSMARLVATAACGSLLAWDLIRALAGHPSRYLIGRAVGGHGYVVTTDLLVLAGLLRWRTSPEDSKGLASHPGRLAGAMLIAGALGVAIDRSQVGQFPIIATVKAGRSSSGLDYLAYLPDGYYRSLRRWPLILALHGRGESGDDIDLVRRQGLPRRVEEEGGLPFVIVAPQSAGWAWDVGSLGALLDEVLRKYRVDPNRVYLTGNSMGGNGTWALAADRPGRFAALAPICGTGDPASAERLRGVPTWAFHGADDRIVPVEKSERMIAALRKAGSDARLTIYPGVGHDSWTPTYANRRLYEWLLQHRRGPAPVEHSPAPVGVPASAGPDRSVPPEGGTPAGIEDSISRRPVRAG